MNRSLIFGSLLAASAAASAQVKVVTTTPDLASIVSAIGGNRVTVSALVTGARDPHRIEAKPSYMSKVGGADIFVAVGLELEAGYEDAILEGSRNRKVQKGQPGHVYSSDHALILERPTGAVSRAMGDIHPEGNPHIWLDPLNGRIFALNIERVLSSQKPQYAAEFKANLAAFRSKLDNAMFGAELVKKFGGDTLWTWERNGQLDQKLREGGASGMLAGWSGRLAPYAGRPILTYHRSLSYLANRFGLRIVAELEPKPGLEPSPGHLAKVIATAQQTGVKAILQETFYPTKHAQFVAGRCGAKVVVIPQNVGHDPAAKDYFSLFDTIVGRIAEAMR